MPEEGGREGHCGRRSLRGSSGRGSERKAALTPRWAARDSDATGRDSDATAREEPGSHLEEADWPCTLHCLGPAATAARQARQSDPKTPWTAQPQCP